MKFILPLLSLFILISPLAADSHKSSKSRLIILADMGNEPDEEQQMHHMLLNSNEFELEGLIAVTGKYLRVGPRPDLFWHLIKGYEEVYPNLKKHAEGYPAPEYLNSIVASGQPEYGILSTGKHMTNSTGTDLIIKAATNGDPRPIWVVINAGSNTLAQALISYQKSSTPEEFAKFLAKFRVFENGSQDNAGAWICANYPDIHWIRSNFQTYCFGGPGRGEIGPNVWEPYEYSTVGQHQWLLKHVIANHGPFGNYYPLRQFHRGGVSFSEGGGTIPWLGLVNKGLFDINQPHWGGWSGRFSREKIKNFWSRHADIKVDEETYGDFYVYGEASDRWVNPDDGTVYDNDFAPIFRFRRAMWNNQKARNDWCYQDYENANHHPVAALNGDKHDTILRMTAKPGQNITLDASGSSDPDGDDLVYSWWNYFEAGTYREPLIVEGSDRKRTSFTVPKDAGGKEIHLVLEVRDENEIANLYDYRRLVIEVE